MIRSQHPTPHLRRLLVQDEGFLVPSQLPQSDGQVTDADQGVGVVVVTMEASKAGEAVFFQGASAPRSWLPP
ncbi:hypothetical protein ACWD3I_47945 [Streptomyces sp. NPDC002817]|uniref:hypothetical protein n=1 Tax=Streptomyces sp. NPDC088357 TaxID=3154655 RepID=UPI00343074AA